MHTTCDRFVLHFALQVDQQTFKFRFAIRVDGQLAPSALGVDQLGQRHFIGIEPALQLREQHVGFLRRFVARLQGDHTVVAGFAESLVVIAPVQVQFVEQHGIGAGVDGVELERRGCVGREPCAQIRIGGAGGRRLPFNGGIVAQRSGDHADGQLGAWRGRSGYCCPAGRCGGLHCCVGIVHRSFEQRGTGALRNRGCAHARVSVRGSKRVQGGVICCKGCNSGQPFVGV